MEKKRRKIVKGKVENWKCKEENLENEERTFFFFFFFFAFHFSKPVKFVLGLPKWKCSIGKKHITPGKIRKKWLCPLREIFLLRPWTLEEVDSWICLDVNIHKNLSWNHHIDSITKSTTCNSTRGLFYSATLHQCPRKTKELCYIHDLSAPHCWVCQHHMESSHS